MEIDFVKLMASKSDEGVQEYIDNRNKFSPVAVYAAIDELKKRGRTITDEECTQIVNDLEKQQEIGRQRVAESDGRQKWDKNVVDDINAIELYSQKAIYGFSIAFGVLFGSILMAMNMKRASSQKSITLTIVFGIVYTVVQLYALSFIPRNTGLTLMTSLGGALILNYVFWKKFIGVDTPYRKRKILTPLVIGVIIFALFMTVMILAPTE